MSIKIRNSNRVDVAGITPFHDEDNMVSDDAGGVASQQSIKAYNDTFVCCEQARAKAASNQSCATASWTIIDLQDDGLECYDVGGNFNNTTHEYTAPVDGYYFIYIQVGLQELGDGKIVTGRVYKDGISWGGGCDAGYVYSPKNNAYIQSVGTSIVHLTAGEALDLRLYHNHGINRTSHGAWGWMNIMLLRRD